MPKPLKTIVTFLQMFSRPERTVRAPLNTRLMLLQAVKPPVAFYRYLYESVGKPWIWVNRRRMTDEDLADAILAKGIRIYVLYVDGCPAGYAELDARNPDNIELAYFGLSPEYVGLGLGEFFLHEAISIAWDMNPKRVHVQTCTLDHPRALPLYQRMGFQPFGQTEAFVEPIGDEPHPLVLAANNRLSARPESD
jgi:GNAT superfamily N-acetyltransferase